MTRILINYSLVSRLYLDHMLPNLLIFGNSLSSKVNNQAFKLDLEFKLSTF